MPAIVQLLFNNSFFKDFHFIHFGSVSFVYTVSIASYVSMELMKITVNWSAKNSARCQRSRAILNLITENDSCSCNLKFLASCDFQTSCLKTSTVVFCYQVKYGIRISEQQHSVGPKFETLLQNVQLSYYFFCVIILFWGLTP